jgi:hypothetical protein
MKCIKLKMILPGICDTKTSHGCCTEVLRWPHFFFCLVSVETFTSMVIANWNGGMRNLRNFIEPMGGILILFLCSVFSKG